MPLQTTIESSNHPNITGSTSFHYSFYFLPKHERQAISTVYAFCRKIDDIVDQGTNTDADEKADKLAQLSWWRSEIDKAYETKNNSKENLFGSDILYHLPTIIHTYGIPKQYFLTLIDGCERDIHQQRYQTFEDLKEYCYAVASIVGLICIEIFGYKYQQTQQYAINLGYALQLTNIIRDVKEDAERGFIYLPIEELQRFQYSEQDLLNSVYDDRFQDLMEFQAKRAREFYHRARTFLAPEERTTMGAAEIMDAIYYRLLEKIQLNDFRVFDRRIQVSKAHKLVTAFRIWIGSKIFVKRIRGGA